MKLLAFDPGEKNYAYSYMQFDGGKLHIIDTGFVEPIYSLKMDSFEIMTKHYTDWLLHLIEDKCKLGLDDVVIVERYQNRFLNAMVELCSVMIGQLSYIAFSHNVPIRLYIPGEWKNHLNNNYWKKRDDYKALAETKKFKKVDPHILINGAVGVDIFPEKVKNRYIKKPAHPKLLEDHISCTVGMGVYHIETKVDKTLKAKLLHNITI